MITRNGRTVSVPLIAIFALLLSCIGGVGGWALAADKEQGKEIQENSIAIAVLETKLDAIVQTTERVEKKVDILVKAVLQNKGATKDTNQLLLKNGEE